MNRFNARIRPALLAAGMALLFYFSGFFVFWTPLPFFALALYGDRAAWRLAFLLTAFAALLFYFLLIPSWIEAVSVARVRFFGFGYLLFYLGLAFFISRAVWSQWSLVTMGWKGAFGVTFLLLLAGFALHGFGILDLAALWQGTLGDVRRALDEALTQPELGPVVLQMKAWAAYLPSLLPSLFFVSALAVMGLNVWGVRLFRRKVNYPPSLGSFRKLQIPHPVVWALIGSGLGFFLNEYVLHWEAFKILALNGLIVSLFVYFLQGLAILAFFASRFSPLFRWGVYGLVLLFLQVSWILLVGVGLADAWLNFRKLKI